jgi:glyoxalase family protein
MSIGGLHHVTAMAGDPGENLRFFTDALGLRLVKRTVNFDDPGTYHLYYGDAVGHPGTVMTFFPSADGRQGRAGTGQVRTTAFRIPAGSVDYWLDRFAERGIDHDDPRERFGATVLPFRDPHGLAYELVAVEAPDDDLDPWDDPVPAEHAIHGFHGVTLTVTEAGPTAEVLTSLGYEPGPEADDRRRFRIGDGADGEARTTGDGGPGSVVDLRVDPDAPRGSMGVGAVHHVAFRTPDDDAQAELQRRLRKAGHRVTEVKDRQYFRSIYFREPGGVLFEIATDPPGFTRDEDRESLGEALKLPPWLEDDRDKIERNLPQIERQEVTR